MPDGGLTFMSPALISGKVAIMKAVKLSRKLHKWLALVVGVQIFLWAASGFYMVVVNIDIIHGDMLVKNQGAPLGSLNAPLVSVTTLLQRYPQASDLSLTRVTGRPVFVLRGMSRAQLFDAQTGEQLSPLGQQQARQVAQYHYAGSGQVSAVTLIENNPPGEIKFFPLPVWRIDFDDAWGSSFYVDPQSGRFMTRRHTLWRVFDFLWMLHIMDYDEREDINNTLLRVFAVAGVTLALTGLWLLFYSFNRRQKTGAAR